MAVGTGSAKRKNETFLLFGKILKSIFCFFGSILEFIGRPALYFLLYSLFSILELARKQALLILYSLSLVGYLTLRLIKLATLIVQTIGTSLLRIRLPRVKIVLPKISKGVIVSLLILCFLLSTFYFFYLSILKDLPKPDKLVTRDQIVSTKIYDRKGHLLYKIYRNQNRTLVKLEDIPLSLRQATIAIEDSEFYSHSGFTLRGIIRAAYNTIFRGKLQGGSTITQQLVNQPCFHLSEP